VVAANLLEGEIIPQAMDILLIALTNNIIPRYESDLVHPTFHYGNSVRRNAYLKMYGNICYDMRGQYVNFPLSSEQNYQL
jgi:ribose transport system substrate-binding protein